MATTGTYAFAPSLGELVLYAYGQIGIRPTALLQEHMQTARVAANLLLAGWANQGVNLWAVELVSVPLVQGVFEYAVPATTVVILDAYIATVANGVETDRIVLPVSRTEYASYPSKTMRGAPTVFWFDRLLSPTVTLWPVPDGTGEQYFKYYRLRQLQDAATTDGATVEIPYVWLDAFADALSARLARTWAPELAGGLKAQAAESYMLAAQRNVENSAVYISPIIAGYFR